MGADRPWLTVLMPAYNEEAGLAVAVVQVLGALDGLGVSHELLVVDDCSIDRTGAVADALAAEHPEMRVVHHSTNLGIGGGMRTGIVRARGEWLILIPADLAMDLSELAKYFAAAQDADVVVGVRSDCQKPSENSDYSAFRRVVSQVNIGLIRLLFRMPLRQFNYISMYRTELLRRMNVEYWRSAFFFAEILIKARGLGARLKEVDITYVPRTSGRATGAKPGLISRTGRDMALFWVRWVLDRPDVK